MLALVLSIACAHGQAYTNWGTSAILPPAEFEHPYPGELTITRVATELEVRLACPSAPFETGRAMGCNKRWAMVRCEIYIVADEVLATVGLDYETTLRHELGHCNGWGGDHAGARYRENFRAMPIPTRPIPPFALFPR